MTTVFDFIDTAPFWVLLCALLVLAAFTILAIEIAWEIRYSIRAHRSHMKRQYRSEYLRPRIGIDKRRGK